MVPRQGAPTGRFGAAVDSADPVEPPARGCPWLWLSRRFTELDVGSLVHASRRAAPPGCGRRRALAFRKARGQSLPAPPRRVGPARVITPGEAGAARAVGRPSTSAPFEQALAGWVAGEPAVPTSELLRRAREIGYRGGKSAFYDLARRLRRTAVRATGRPELAPGVYSRHALVRTMIDLEGTRGAALDVLASELAWSGAVHVELLSGWDDDALVHGLRATFAAFGGAPLATVWSGPRWLVRGAPGREVRWAPALAAEAVALGFALLIDGTAGPAAGAVHLGAALKRRFFRARRFRDRGDVERALGRWLAEANAERQPALAEERARLRPAAAIAPQRDV